VGCDIDLCGEPLLTGTFVSTLDSTTTLHRATLDTTGKPRLFLRLRATTP
jgi:hypothetical protein